MSSFVFILNPPCEIALGNIRKSSLYTEYILILIIIIIYLYIVHYIFGIIYCREKKNMLLCTYIIDYK